MPPPHLFPPSCSPHPNPRVNIDLHPHLQFKNHQLDLSKKIMDSGAEAAG